MPLEIRKATVADIDLMVEFRDALFNVWGEGTEELKVANADYMKWAIPDEVFHGWIAELDGRPVGTGAIVLMHSAPTVHAPDGREAYVLNMYTVDEARRSGAASRLMETMIDFCREIGVTRIWLRASEYGRPVYERLGFTDPGDYLQLDL